MLDEQALIRLMTERDRICDRLDTLTAEAQRLAPHIPEQIANAIYEAEQQIAAIDEQVYGAVAAIAPGLAEELDRKQGVITSGVNNIGHSRSYHKTSSA
jgi:hypothetical protein